MYFFLPFLVVYKSEDYNFLVMHFDFVFFFAMLCSCAVDASCSSSYEVSINADSYTKFISVFVAIYRPVCTMTLFCTPTVCVFCFKCNFLL